MKAIAYHEYGPPDVLRCEEIEKPVDRRYGLREVPEAIRYLDQGHAPGKVVITLEAI